MEKNRFVQTDWGKTLVATVFSIPIMFSIGFLFWIIPWMFYMLEFICKGAAVFLFTEYSKDLLRITKSYSVQIIGTAATITVIVSPHILNVLKFRSEGLQIDNVEQYISAVNQYYCTSITPFADCVLGEAFSKELFMGLLLLCLIVFSLAIIQKR